MTERDAQTKRAIRSDRPRPPSVDAVLSAAAADDLIARYGRQAVTGKVRAVISALREAIQAGETPGTDTGLVLEQTRDLLEIAARASLGPVLNLTGTVVHTNLGRAPLPEEAIEAMAEVARGASNLEYDLDKGARGNRDAHFEALLVELTGAEAATVVNNNAAGVMLVLNTLALGGEVPVSRGELVEIGGSFRIPEIMSRAGCRLVEVGTTNRTHLKDYANAIGEATALVMKVHASNYVIEGFTAEVSEARLAGLCKSHDLPFAVDLGAGSLVDLQDWGLPHEPTPRETLAAGADLVCFSGDKLLGGPQAGIIAGKKALIDRLRANPMKRALRCDKMTIAALEAVLRLYRDPDRLAERLPVLRMLTRSREDIRPVAEAVAASLAARLRSRAGVEVVECDSVIGSGALPSKTLPSLGVSIRPEDPALTEAGIAEAFRRLPVPVIGRVQDGAFLLDIRCLEDAGALTEMLDGLKIA